MAAARTKAPTRRAADRALERDAAEVLAALTELVRVYQFRDRNRICCHDVSVTQCYALQAIAQRGPLPLGAVAAELLLDKSTTSRVVDALERKGYARRGADPDDARALRLSATAKGRALLAGIERDLLAEQMAVVHGFAPEVRQAAAQLLRKLARATAARVACCPDRPA